MNVPEDELWWSLEFWVDLLSKVSDLCSEELDVLIDGLMRVIEFELIGIALIEIFFGWDVSLFFH